MSTANRPLHAQTPGLVLLGVLCGILSLSGCVGLTNSSKPSNGPANPAGTVAVKISPNTATVAEGTRQQFAATVTGSSNTSVTWSVAGAGCSSAACGTISGGGLYTPPASVPSPATLTVTVTSVADPTKTASATVGIVAAAAVLLSISPTSATVPAASTDSFTASVTGATNTAVAWSLSGAGCGGASCGTLATSLTAAVYTAPLVAPSPPSVTVAATSMADPTKTASATVTIVAAAAVLLSINPTSATVPTATTDSFTASVTGTTNTAVAWSLSGAGCSGISCGTLSTSSLTAIYKAPVVAPSPPSVSVVATSMAAPNKSASASVTIVSVVSVAVTPSSASVATGATQQLTASVIGSSNAAVTWSVQGTGCSPAACGTVNSNGLYTAPSAVPSPAAVSVTATSSADPSKAASASVSIFSASGTNTAYGLAIPAGHPRLFWTPSRVTAAQAWVKSSSYAGLNTSSARPLDDYDMAFTCYVMNVAGACSQVITDALAFSPSGSNGVGAGDDNMRRNGEWIMLVRDWLSPGCGKAQCLTSAQVSTIDTNWSTWQSNQDNATQTWGNVGMPANNYFAGQFRNDFDFGIASYSENTNADANLKYGTQSRWPDMLNFVSPTGTGKNGARGYALHSQEGGGEYGRYSLNYYALALASSALLGRDMWTETTAFKSGVFQTIYNTMPTVTTSRSMWDMFTWGDDENWASGANCGYQSHNGPDGHGGCGASSQYYGDFMQAAANEFSGTAVGKLARQWISTVNPAIGAIHKSVDPGGSAQAYSTMPLDYYSSGAQYMYSRSDWTATGTSMLWQMGIYNGDNVGSVSWGGGHSHQDAGTFQVSRKGVNIIRETPAYSETVAGYNGVGTADASTGFAHNIPFVGGQASINIFSGCSDGPGIVKRLETQPGYSFAVTDLTLTYQNNACDSGHPTRENPYVAAVVRELYYFRGINVLLVVDRLQTDVSTRSTTFVSHCETKPTVTAATIACIDGTQEALYTALVPAAPAIAIVAENANGANAVNWQYRIEANNSNPGNAVSYNIYTIQLGDASGFSALTPGVVDSSPGNPLSGTFTITIDPSDSLVINKGIASSGGTIKAAGATRALATAVQGMAITDNGPAWQ